MARALRRLERGGKFNGDGLDRLCDGYDAGSDAIGNGIKSALHRGDGMARLPGLWPTATVERVSVTSNDHPGR